METTDLGRTAQALIADGESIGPSATARLPWANIPLPWKANCLKLEIRSTAR
jgi:hypothetical protein